jgi:hypothetical protein
VDPISALILGSLVLTACAKVGLDATTDAVTTLRASKAGQWDLIDRDRARRAASRQVWAKAWAERRVARHRKAGGDGDYRPGAREYGRDLYHGFWEDMLERRGKKRAVRPEWVYDPDRPSLAQRFDAAVLDRVGRIRASRGWEKTKNAARVLVEPVPTKPERRAADSAVADRTPDDPNAQPADDGLGELDQMLDRQSGVAPDVNEPDPESGATCETSDEGAVMSVDTAAAAATEVQDNEAARRNFQAQSDAAGDAADALAAYEAALARLSAAAGAAEGMSAQGFDSGAVQAQANIADQVPGGDIAAAVGALEEIKAEAESGLKSLEKYRDSEDLVAAERINAKTLESTSA